MAAETPVRAAKTVYVHAGALSGKNDGTSWKDAFSELQDGLAAAKQGDQVWVAAGVYKPTTGTAQHIYFILPQNVTVLGGFAGFETSADQRDPGTNVTTLSGNIGFLRDAFDNSYHVVYAAGSAGAVLDGFTITGGYADTGTSNRDKGGGIFATSTPTFRNLLVTGNYAFRGGGGIAVAGGDPVFEAVQVVGNGADIGYGGGLHVFSGDATVTGSEFRSNEDGGMRVEAPGEASVDSSLFVSNRGAGLTVKGAPVEVRRSAFVGNVGIGIYASSGDITVTDSTFAANSAAEGGGVYASSNSSVSLDHVTFSLNRAKINGAAIDLNSGTGTIRNSVFWNNIDNNVDPVDGKFEIQNSILEGGCPDTSTCDADTTFADPVLTALGDHGGLTPTFGLAANSPAIDTGDPDACTTTDQRGVARPQDGNLDTFARCDRGAFEYEPSTPTVAFATPTSSAAEAAGSRSMTVSLSTKYPAEIKVNYRVTGGSARVGRDYAAFGGSVTFAPYVNTKSISFTGLDDFFVEPGETIVVQLTSATVATLGATTVHTHTITDNEPKGVCDGSAATMAGTPGHDTIRGTTGVDVIIGLGGNDTIRALGGSDIICGGDGEDDLRGGRGNDRVFGEKGTDATRGESGDDFLDGGEGNDSVLGAGGHDRGEGGSGTDRVVGGTGNDELEGGTGAGDRCAGGPGIDAATAADGCERKTGIP
jgi:hypothetical protein